MPPRPTDSIFSSIYAPKPELAEAHYVCGVINSSPSNYAVKSYSTVGSKSFGTPHVLEHVFVPTFDTTNEVHLKLAHLSKKAHSSIRTGGAANVQEIEAEIDQLVARLWGLTDEELREIQESLQELT